MEKAKNMLLALGIILYIVDIFLNLIISTPWNANSKYSLYSILLSCVSIVIFSVLPLVLLVLNLRNKYNKPFIITVTILSALSTIYLLIDPYFNAVPQYLLLSKLGLIDTIWVYLFTSGGILGLISSIMITVAAILSLKKYNDNKTEP